MTGVELVVVPERGESRQSSIDSAISAIEVLS